LEKGDVIVLELVRGVTLRELLRDRPKYAEELVGETGNIKIQVQLIEQLAEALRACHSAGVVHKDLKPENIIISQSGGLWLPKIIDFGLAAEVEEGKTTPTLGPYSPGYTPPERYRGEPRKMPADVFLLGVTAYELLSGARPFPPDDTDALLTGRFVSLKDARPDVPIRLSDLVAAMLRPEPAKRPNVFTLASELRSSLDAADWQECFKRGSEAAGADPETAFDYLCRAAFGTPVSERQTTSYLKVLSLLVDTATRCHKVLDVAPQLIQPIVITIDSTVCEVAEKAAKTLDLLVNKALREMGTAEAKRRTLALVLDTLLENSPKSVLKDIPLTLLLNSAEPSVWERYQEIFLLALRYHEQGLFDGGFLAECCIGACAQLRRRGQDVTACLVWLQRAARLGAATSAEFTKEEKALQAVETGASAKRSLPPLSARQEDPSKVVGEYEKAHLNTVRISRWAERILKSYPFVEMVRRVGKDHGPAPRPTRILGRDNLARHRIKGIDDAQIIPVLLDDSYCIRSDCAVRMNIVLPKGTTLSQNEAAVELLKTDNTLFGSDS